MSEEGNPRRTRVAQAMRKALSELISSELQDPRISKAGFVSINHIDLNKDMGVATIFVGFYGGDEAAAEAGVVALNRAAGRLRGPLARTMKLQRAPELRFSHDQSGEFGVRLSQIIRDDGLRRAQSAPEAVEDDQGTDEADDD